MDQTASSDTDCMYTSETVNMCVTFKTNKDLCGYLLLTMNDLTVYLRSTKSTQCLVEAKPPPDVIEESVCHSGFNIMCLVNFQLIYWHFYYILFFRLIYISHSSRKAQKLNISHSFNTRTRQSQGSDTVYEERTMEEEEKRSR